MTFIKKKLKLIYVFKAKIKQKNEQKTIKKMVF